MIAELRYGSNVPFYGMPLAHIKIPVPTIGDAKIIGNSQFTKQNVDGLTKIGSFASLVQNATSLSLSFSASSVLTDNKVTDPSFGFNFTPGSSTVVTGWCNSLGIWNYNLTGGRTNSNSFYAAGDEPGLGSPGGSDVKCAYFDWANTGASGVIYTDTIARGTGSPEVPYTPSQVLYQLSFWIATDPVDNTLVRRGPLTSQTQSVINTDIELTLVGYNVTGTISEVIGDYHIKYSDLKSRVYLTQKKKKFLKVTLPFFQVGNLTERVRINVGGINIAGVYFDDFRLRSYLYTETQSTNSLYNNLLKAGLNLLTNPELSGSSTFGDFSQEFGLNLLKDPGFETRLGWTGTATYKPGGHIGNNHIELYTGGDTMTQTIPLDNTKLFQLNTYAARQLASYAAQANIIGTFLDGASGVISTFTLTVLPTGTAWQPFNIVVTPTTGTAFLKVQIVPITVGGSGSGISFDDTYLFQTTQLFPSWNTIEGSLANNSIGSLSYLEAGNRFVWGYYNKPGSGTNYHFVEAQRTIYKNNTYNFSQDFIDRYANTKDELYCNTFTVAPSSIYGMSFDLTWPGAVANYTLDMDNTVKGAFTEPFLINFVDPRSGSAGLVKNNIYGSVRITVEGVSGGTVIETPLDYTISSQFSNLPTHQYFDNLSNRYFDNITLPRFQFATALTGRIRFTFVGTLAGVKNTSFTAFTVISTGAVTGSGIATTLYKLSNQIKINGIALDETEGWRVKVKDGIFERNFTIPTNEPADSWLFQAGFTIGDNINLVYTVPGYNLDNYYNNEKHQKEITRGYGTTINTNQVFLGNTNIAGLKELIINDIVTFSSNGYVVLEQLAVLYPTIFKDGVSNTGSVTLVKSGTNRDIVKATYIYSEKDFIYRGYFDGAVWRDLDLNTEAGHRYHIGEDGAGQPGKSLIDNGVTLYLIPTCAYYASGNVSGVLDYRSALYLDPSIRPTSFIRHSIGTDINNNLSPSSVILGRIFVTNPGTIEDIKILDVRTRGGGVPQEFIDTSFIEEDRIKTLANTWTNSEISIFPGDQVDLSAFGNSLSYNISTTIPTTGTTYTALFTSTTSGSLFIKTTVDSYIRIRIKRTTYLGTNWDLNDSWDGQPVTMNGVVVIEIPKDILTGANGYTQFSSQQVQEIVNKHVGAGIYPIIKYV